MLSYYLADGAALINKWLIRARSTDPVFFIRISQSKRYHFGFQPDIHFQIYG